MRRGISRNSGTIFHDRYLYGWNIFGALKVSVGTFRQELSEDVSFGVGTVLVVEKSSWENRPKGV